MIEALHFPFIQNAILAGVLAAVACGVIGSLVVVNRSVFMAGGIAHAAYGGVGIAFFFALPPLPCIIAFSLFIAMIMAALTVKRRGRMDTIIGVLWAVGMATGIILIDLTPGYNVDLMSFLFGSILAVSSSDVHIMAGLVVVIVSVVTCFYKELLSVSYDREFSQVRGVPVVPLHFLVLALVAIAVVMTIRLVGLILVMALFTIAPYLVERYVSSLVRMMIWASLLNIFFVLFGLWLSWRFDLTSGATIILTAAVFFVVFELLSWVVRSTKIGSVRR